jgi:hypothetical protein
VTHTFTTTLTLPDETEAEVTVTYTYYAPYKGDLTDPPEPASVEIQSVAPDVPMECYDGLVEECFDNQAQHMDDVADWRYEMRRNADY